MHSRNLVRISMPRSTLVALLISLVLISVGSCGSSPTAPSAAQAPVSVQAGATVRFDYRASTTLSPDLAQACVDLSGPVHIHPSWQIGSQPPGQLQFNLPMRVVGTDLWQYTFTDEPIFGQLGILGKVHIGVRLAIRVTDPNLCTENDTTPDATRNVFANDVRLVDVVAIPAQGTTRAGTGLAFTVGADGGVTP